MPVLTATQAQLLEVQECAKRVTQRLQKHAQGECIPVPADLAATLEALVGALSLSIAAIGSTKLLSTQALVNDGDVLASSTGTNYSAAVVDGSILLTAVPV